MSYCEQRVHRDVCNTIYLQANISIRINYTLSATELEDLCLVVDA